MLVCIAGQDASGSILRGTVLQHLNVIRLCRPMCVIRGWAFFSSRPVSYLLRLVDAGQIKCGFILNNSSGLRVTAAIIADGNVT